MLEIIVNNGIAICQAALLPSTFMCVGQEMQACLWHLRYASAPASAHLITHNSSNTICNVKRNESKNRIIVIDASILVKIY